MEEEVVQEAYAAASKGEEEDRNDCSQYKKADGELAVEEVVANVINYSGATGITVRAKVENGQLALTIEDDGKPFDPTQGSTTDLSLLPDQRPPGGLGLIFLHQMVDELAYQYTDGHNILTIIKRTTNGHQD